MKKLNYIFGVLLAFQACASGPQTIAISLDPLSPAPVVDGGFARDKQVLEAYVRDHSSDAELLRDASFIFEGRAADRAADLDASVKAWYRALEISQGSFGEVAFHGWLKAYTKKLGRKIKRVELAKLVLAETQTGYASPWMADRGIHSEDRISRILTKEVPEYIEEDAAIANAKVDAPRDLGIRLADPLLVQLAAEVCRSKVQYGTGWETWRATLKTEVNKYFDGLVLQCSGQGAKAVEQLSDVVPLLAANPSSAHLALEGYSRIIKMRRDQGERESVAPLYLPFMKLWQDPSINESSLGISRAEFEQRRIDDTLWAARARAVVGDGETAKIFADDVLRYLATALAQSYTLSMDQKNNLAGQMAETYQLMAFRVAVDARDWNKAFSITSIALEQPMVPTEWRTRLQWSQGIYKYLAMDYEQASKLWEQLLSNSEDDRLRPQLLFWVAQAKSKLGNEAEASFYRKSLARDFPLSFYSVVALKQSEGDNADAWTTPFRDLKGLKKSLLNWQKMDIEDLRSDPVRGLLVRRAEIFSSLGITQFSAFAVDELQKSIDFTSGGERSQVWGLYVSRLSSASGNWLSAISLTTKLAKEVDFWKKRPEQMLVYFPRPYLSIYQAIGAELKVDPSVLLGISRQESTFRVDVKSGANAWGLMQLTPPTARRLLPMAGFTDPTLIQIPEALVRPDVNIRFGAAFASELFARFASNRGQIYAAYNAGSQAVDGWIARRLVDDPIMFVELIPYLETRDYVKAVWRNEMIYGFLDKQSLAPSH
jgi:tetratricopeptide (TPR) repeat protein